MQRSLPVATRMPKLQCFQAAQETIGIARLLVFKSPLQAFKFIQERTTDRGLACHALHVCIRHLDLSIQRGVRGRGIAFLQNCRLKSKSTAKEPRYHVDLVGSSTLC
jgi:hypothetical protein